MSNEDETNPIQPDEVFPEGFNLGRALNDEGIDPTVEAIYGAIASPTMLRLLSNDPFTMSAETRAYHRTELFGAAKNLIDTIAVLSEEPVGGFDQNDILMRYAAQELLDAVGGLLVVSSARDADDPDAATLRALMGVAAAAEGLARFTFTFTDNGDGTASGECGMVFVSDETDGE